MANGGNGSMAAKAPNAPLIAGYVSEDKRRAISKASHHPPQKDETYLPNVVNLLPKGIFENSYSTSFAYSGFGVNIARCAITQMLKELNFEYAADSRQVTARPSMHSVSTDVDEQSEFVNNIIVRFEDGLLQAIHYPDCEEYVVAFMAESKEKLSALVGTYKGLEKKSNFYQGKCIRFAKDGPVFVSTPHVRMDDVVVPAKVRKEFELNCINFLKDKTYHEVVKKRGILLYGPPGTGKTSLVSAAFNELNLNKISCAFVTDESFYKVPLQAVFDIVVGYLTPALLVFEDIDLVGRARGNGLDGVVGQLLTALNGISEVREPLVVVGTTNRLDAMDTAVTRPCRFDRKLEIPYPKNGEVKALFEKICGCPPPEGKDFTKSKITGSHIKDICQTALLLKAKAKTGEVQDYIAEATEDVMSGYFNIEPGVGFQPNGEDDWVAKEDSPAAIYGAETARLVSATSPGNPFESPRQ